MNTVNVCSAQFTLAMAYSEKFFRKLSKSSSITTQYKASKMTQKVKTFAKVNTQDPCTNSCMLSSDPHIRVAISICPYTQKLNTQTKTIGSGEMAQQIRYLLLFQRLWIQLPLFAKLFTAACHSSLRVSTLSSGFHGNRQPHAHTHTNTYTWLNR